ncbi:hypothetical protein [Bifidobacterium gallicum]|uniref:Carbon starvation protein n=1 Tax=Bifidobacterium gallicum DSM 20093 = LMG 11596 TaxID=561180 RepID=D1NSH1_9BIFI|nr:hypothetical protein [Bifidobacterium gallicum]EFA23623.1 hypothetical protein BIFGAL_02728 [Bifidobacterium gallicum DSM 20093 = LMG 11596]KFI58684.1 carbon starvation protein [Bifidobacterium gallicum DSM 20093 = LMG 11596]
MKLNAASRARLYALTSVATAIWFVQNIVQTQVDGTLFTWSNIIFSLCILIVCVYCAVNAVKGWVTHSVGDTTGQTADHTQKGAAIHPKS